MASHEEIYSSEANAYDAMIGKQPNLLEIVNEIRPFRDLDVLDLGAGSGRLSTFIAPQAGSLICTDLSRSMLDVLDLKLNRLNQLKNWTTIEADHRNLPIADSSIDLVVSGWSICYLASTNNSDWENNLKFIFSELDRILKPNGTIIIFETMGTGTETPNPPDFLTSYYSLLENKYGFKHKWIRTDYHFESMAEAIRNTEFFFGEDVVTKIKENKWTTVPECAGVWWKHL